MESRNDLIKKRIADFLKLMDKSSYIKSEILEEITNHLQDHIEDQMQQGIALENAISQAFFQIGNRNELVSEFRKNAQLYSLFWRPMSSILFSKRLIAFVLLFAGLTFGSIFAERSKISKPYKKSASTKDSMQKSSNTITKNNRKNHH